MSDMIGANGGMIEKKFLEENIAEARNYTWTPSSELPGGDHGHCIVCMVAVAKGEAFYRSENVLLCSHCHGRFIFPDG